MFAGEIGAQIPSHPERHTIERGLSEMTSCDFQSPVKSAKQFCTMIVSHMQSRRAVEVTLTKHGTTAGLDHRCIQRPFRVCLRSLRLLNGDNHGSSYEHDDEHCSDPKSDVHHWRSFLSLENDD